MFSIFRAAASESQSKRRVYLDYAAASPLSPRARAAMMDFFDTRYGNASAIHTEGQAARHAIEDSRKEMARMVEVQPSQVFFTSGGTESNNLAIRGLIEQYHRLGRAYEDVEVITTLIEHPATKKTVEALSQLGVVVKYVGVDSNGMIKQIDLADALSDKTVLVCVSYVNSEIGTIEAIGAIGRLLQKVAPETLLFVDAAQAPLWLPCVLPQLRADIIAFDAGKFGGPQGVGMLVLSKRVKLEAVTFGGGQERGLRPGTEPGALIVGAVVAFVDAQRNHQTRSEQIMKVRDYALTELSKAIPGLFINGAVGERRVANNINISIPGLDSEYAVITLDVHGVAASTKSACSSVGGGISTVVMETTADINRAASTLRFTLGPDTTTTDIDIMIKILATHLSLIATQ